MATLPKSSAEILAAAIKAPIKQIRPCKPKTDCKKAFLNNLSIFSAKPSLTASDESPTSVHVQSGPHNVHPISNTHFLDPITPQTLEAALEIREMRKEDDHDEDLFDDEPDTWVFCFTLCVMRFISYISII
jgi:hypothetical protein